MDSMIFGLLILAVVAFIILQLVMWIWMLVDCLQNEPSTGNDKVIWVLLMVFLGVIGSLLYYFIRRPQRIEQLGK
ncbi:MAG: PLD nuclease N-terminal domain-containing protein [Planctomycetota bacterium]|jgi:LPXTG-motif cell wall-anchored protein|uniref:PLD nuclease N-terminal domain-containing protein n=1 Tax=uncultured Gimesia sp. TaxID=1678688 RepID=UPI0026187431|nr:PLD nuclease N-terminal domain-containing protein [uncultured Gimesia sp.]